MKLVIIIATLAVVALADQRSSYIPPAHTYGTPPPPPPPTPPPHTYGQPAAASNRAEVEVAPPAATLRDERTHGDDGSYSVDVEADNGISFSESGSPSGEKGAIVKSGQYMYTAPDGTHVIVKYVADENGFQPQSDLLPVAPAFPHPIPQFVLDQIAFAAREDAAAAAAGARDAAASSQYSQVAAPSNLYERPQ